jgi:hypothetical protein
MSETLFPSWKDVGVPNFIIENIKHIRSAQFLGYLVLNRVFRYEVKPQYNYHCRNCDYRKQNVRAYEDYSVCESCGYNDISAFPIWRMGKDKATPISEMSVPGILQMLEENYNVYFQKEIPEDFIDVQWRYAVIKTPMPDGEVDKMVYSKAYAKFACGEEVEAESHSFAVAKAAILCPFLWDDLFDWKYGVTKEKGRETPIIPLLAMWNKYPNTRVFSI